MFREMLVPLDGTRLAEDAIPVAAALAERHKARLHFVAVSRPLIAGFSGVPFAAEAPVVASAELDRLAANELEGYLRRWATNVGRADGLAIREAVLTGIEPVAEQLLGYIARHRIDLVVMHTHGRGVVGRMWLGSVANALVQQSGVPCLLLRGPAARTEADQPLLPVNPRRVLVPLDGSDEAELALEFAMDIGAPDRTAIDLLAVVTPLPFPATVLDGTTAAEREASAESYLDGVATRIERRGFHARTCVASHSSPPRAIAEHIEQEQVDLLTIAAHHRSEANRVFLGSVIDSLLRRTRIPMLVWRSRELAGTSLLPVVEEGASLAVT